MNHLKALSKHYIRRALNKVRYPQGKDQTLFINSWSLQHPLIFIECEFKGVNYQNKIEFTDLTEDDFKSVDAATLNLLVAHIAIMMSNVFFKIDHINRIECRFAAFGPNWTEFHQYLLSRALGEFKFLQGLSLHHPLTVAGNAVCKTDTQLPPREFNEQCLVMNGGGKDSITSGELAKQAGLPFAWYTVGLNTGAKNRDRDGRQRRQFVDHLQNRQQDWSECEIFLHPDRWPGIHFCHRTTACLPERLQIYCIQQ